jgi:hypothetical protein
VSQTRQIKYGSDLERRILQEIRDRVRFWERIVGKKFEDWREAEERVLAALPTDDMDAVRKNDRENAGSPQYTTMQIPYSYAVVMAAHTYLTSVFMGRNPVLQLDGRHGEGAAQVQAMEALLGYQMLAGEMGPALYTWLYDSLKYGFGVIGIYWDDVVENITELIPAVDWLGQPTNGFVQQTTQIRRYAGNTIYNVQPQFFIWDVRKPVKEFQKGEFAGRRVKISWNEIVRRTKAGKYMEKNIAAIGPGKGEDYSITDMGSPLLERPESYAQTQQWNEVLNIFRTHPMMVDAYEMVIEIIPKEWGLSQSDFPEKWVFTCTANYGVLFGAAPLGAYHCKYPYMVCPMDPEAYGLTNRGYPEVLADIQNTIDWLLNSHFYNVRAALNNKVVADPSRIVMKDLLNPLPGGVIRLKPEAYGTDTKGPVTQLAIADITRGHMADLPAMIGIGERTAGVNDQIMGLLATGGRKTATEVRTSTSFGVNRLKTLAEYMSMCGWSPLTQILVQNSQQYYDMDMKLRIVGDLAQQAGQPFVNVTPDAIAGFYDFIPVDGTLPIDRFAQANLWKEMIQSVMAIPQISAQFDLAGIFQWVAMLSGLKNINQFKVQITPDQQFQLALQQGNSVPLVGGKRRGGNGAAPKGNAGGASPGLTSPVHSTGGQAPGPALQ